MRTTLLLARAEGKYWRDYKIICGDVSAPMVSCYTHRTINHLAATEIADIIFKDEGLVFRDKGLVADLIAGP